MVKNTIPVQSEVSNNEPTINISPQTEPIKINEPTDDNQSNYLSINNTPLVQDEPIINTPSNYYDSRNIVPINTSSFIKKDNNTTEKVSNPKVNNTLTVPTKETLFSDNSNNILPAPNDSESDNIEVTVSKKDIKKSRRDSLINNSL